MNEDKVTDLILKISTELATLNAQTKSVLDKLANHEGRLMQLEQSKTSMKDDLLKWLTRALIVALASIASLTGATTLISKLLTN